MNVVVAAASWMTKYKQKAPCLLALANSSPFLFIFVFALKEEFIVRFTSRIYTLDSSTSKVAS